MHSPLMLVLVAVLFFLLTPGVLVRLPPKSGLLVVAAFHAVVFTVVYFLVFKLLKKYLYRKEGFDGEDDENHKKSKEGYVAAVKRK